MLQSLAWRSLNLMIGAWFLIKFFLLGFCSFLSFGSSYGQSKDSYNIGCAGWNKIQGFPTNSQKERKMEDAGCSGLMVFSLLSFST